MIGEYFCFINNRFYLNSFFTKITENISTNFIKVIKVHFITLNFKYLIFEMMENLTYSLIPTFFFHIFLVISFFALFRFKENNLLINFKYH